MFENPFSIYQDKKISDQSINKDYSTKVIEIFDFSSEMKTRLDRLNISPKKINYLGFLIFICLAVLLIRLFQLQIAEGSTYRAQAEENRLRLEIEPASRGIIYDRHLNPLVKNVPNFNLNINPLDFPAKHSEIVEEISRIINQAPNEIEEKIKNLPSSNYQTYTLLEQIPYEQALILISKSRQWPGVEIKTQAIREYLHPQGFSHFMGYIGKINTEELEKNPGKYTLTDYLGKSGLELYYEDLLKGQPNKKQIEVDSSGRAKEIIAEEKAKPGRNLILSLDLELENKATEILQKYIDQRQAPGGVVIIMDPRQGEVLSLVNLPSYDQNKFNEQYADLLAQENNPLFNRALSGVYPPGSTFKLIVAAAALQEKVVTADTTVNSTGGVQVNNWFFPDWKSGGHGLTDLKKALAESVNTYFYLAGGGTYDAEKNEIKGGLGVDRINKYASKFYVDKLLGIDLPGEKAGFLPTKEWKQETKGEMWYIGDTYHLAIGQGDALATPLHIASATATIANSGTLYQPHILKSISDEHQNILQEKEVEVLDQNFISAANLRIVRDGMRQAVTDGSAKALQSLPVAAAGKTGTAQASGTDKTHSWFTGFAPYDQPEIVITVLVEEGGEATEAALPAAREILDYYFSR